MALALRSTITALQEVHGSEAAFRMAIPDANTAFHIFSSFTDNSNEGGVVTVIKKNGSPPDCFNAELIIDGRALRVEYADVSLNASALVHWNIHNHDLGSADGAGLPPDFTRM